MGTRENRLGGVVLTGTHNLCLDRNMKNIRFLSENFQGFDGEIFNIIE